MTTAVREARFATLPRVAAGFKPSIPIRARYDNWIGGEYAAPFRGQYFVNPTPITGQPLCEVARSTPGGRGQGAGRGARGRDQLERHLAHLPGQHPQPDRRPDRGQHRDARVHRDHRQRQTDPGDHCGRPAAGRGSLPLLRRLHPGPGRRAVPAGRRHRRLSLPRAARRGRPDHPLELPAADGHLEAGAGARGRKLRGPETGGTDPGFDHGPDGADRRHPAERSGQRGAGLRSRGGQAAGVEPAGG